MQVPRGHQFKMKGNVPADAYNTINAVTTVASRKWNN